MGLSQLRSVLDPDPLDLDRVNGERVAVDANNVLWTFVTGMARGGAPTGPHGREISHVIGLVNRTRYYASLGMEPVWVFDGAPPKLKAETIAERREKIEAAREDGDLVQGARLEGFQIEEAKTLLDALGVAWIEAPGEADAQLAAWARDGHVDAAITQDYDCALFGCPNTYRNVTRNGRRSPEHLALEAALEREALTRSQLVDAAVLIGTDYNEGIHGVGPVTGVRLVQEHGDLAGALKARGCSRPRALAARELFLDPKVEKGAPPRPTGPDGGAVREELARHGLEGRAKRLVGALETVYARA